MPKMTLGDIVQSTLSSMDSDDVNSIDGTEESLQVAEIAKDTFFEVISQAEWPHTTELTQLQSTATAAFPAILRIPDNVERVLSIRYEVEETDTTERGFPLMIYKKPEEFLACSYALSNQSDEDNVVEMVVDGVSLFVKNDLDPCFWTSFNDEDIVFDSYNSTVETTLQGRKTTVDAEVEPVWEMSDTFVPDLPSKTFPLYLAEVKRASHLYLRQQDSAIDAKRSIRGWSKMRQDGWRAHERKDRPRFGRGSGFRRS